MVERGFKMNQTQQENVQLTYHSATTDDELKTYKEKLTKQTSQIEESQKQHIALQSDIRTKLFCILYLYIHEYV